MAKATPVDQDSSLPDGHHVNFIDSKNEEVTEEQINELVVQQGYTHGLAEALATNAFVFPFRIWVVDNSGSMNRIDGHQIVESRNRNSIATVECTRWSEIKECVNYHAHIATLFNAPTDFAS
jgi:isochorismate hydrolase